MFNNQQLPPQPQGPQGPPQQFPSKKPGFAGPGAGAPPNNKAAQLAMILKGLKK